jgi:hypothetical protein
MGLSVFRKSGSNGNLYHAILARNNNEVALVLAGLFRARNTHDSGKDIILSHVSSFLHTVLIYGGLQTATNFFWDLSLLHNYYSRIFTQSQMFIRLSHTFEVRAQPY